MSMWMVPSFLRWPIKGLNPLHLLLTGRSMYHILEWWNSSEVMLSCHLCSV